MSGMAFDHEKMFYEQTEGKDYFLVTQFNEFDAQADLKDKMYASFPVLEETDDYLIFDLRHPLKPAGQETVPAE
jgi:hypothetical protein